MIKDYLKEFEEYTNPLLIDYMKEDYNKLIKEAEQLINDKDVDKISEFKNQLNSFIIY